MPSHIIAITAPARTADSFAAIVAVVVVVVVVVIVVIRQFSANSLLSACRTRHGHRMEGGMRIYVFGGIY
jgi:hypothetical protein